MTHMPFRAVLVVSALAAVAFGAPPKKSIGGPKEDEPCPRGWSGADVALFRAQQWVFEPAPPEIRVQALEDLGLLGDPRGLNVAAQFILDPNPRLARAAVRAIGSIRHPRAQEILSNVVRHPLVPHSTKILALEALPFQNTWAAFRFVQASARNGALPAPVLNAARRLALSLPLSPRTTAPAAAAAPASAPISGDSK
jgi:HEAT repeat protein